MAGQLYVAALVDGFHSAAAPHPPTLPGLPAPDRPGAMLAAATRAFVSFLARCVADAAIVGPDLREALLASLERLLAQPRCLAAFEASADARAGVVRTPPCSPGIRDKGKAAENFLGSSGVVPWRQALMCRKSRR